MDPANSPVSDPKNPPLRAGTDPANGPANPPLSGILAAGDPLYCGRIINAAADVGVSVSQSAAARAATADNVGKGRLVAQEARARR